jgi:hypothetical protein
MIKLTKALSQAPVSALHSLMWLPLACNNVDAIEDHAVYPGRGSEKPDPCVVGVCPESVKRESASPIGLHFHVHLKRLIR